MKIATDNGLKELSKFSLMHFLLWMSPHGNNVGDIFHMHRHVYLSSYRKTIRLQKQENYSRLSHDMSMAMHFTLKPNCSISAG